MQRDKNNVLCMAFLPFRNCHGQTGAIKNEATGLSALETARRAYDTAQRFVQDFDHKFENLFLYGDTGVGKTFLSHCIARELLRSTHCVLYFSAYDLFDMMAANSFSRKDTGTDEELPLPSSWSPVSRERFIISQHFSDMVQVQSTRIWHWIPSMS